MIWALAPWLAIAGPPPKVDLEDIDKWENAAETLLDLPRGCWEWVGQASWDWDTGKYSTRGDAIFAGKTDDGVWGDVHLQPLGELLQDRRGNVARVYEHNEARFTPLVGRLLGGRIVVGPIEGENGAELADGAEAVNVLRQAIRRVSGDAFVSWAEWSDERGGVVLNRAIPLAVGRAEEIEVKIFFPSGGDVPSYLDVRFPAKFKAGKWPRWTVRDAEVHVRGLIRGSVVYPSSEAFKFKYRFLGRKRHAAQTVVYKRITRCPAPPKSESIAMPEIPVPKPAPEGDATATPAATTPEGATEDSPEPSGPADGTGPADAPPVEGSAERASGSGRDAVSAEEALEAGSPTRPTPN